MKAVMIDEAKIPRVCDLDAPAENDGLEIVSVRAAALTNLDVMIAEGRHYFSPTIWPTGVGREGVVDAGTGRMYVNVNAIPSSSGSMAERTLANLAYALPVPEGIDDARAAVLGNSGLAAWLPLSWRAKMKHGDRVLILGATGTTGLIAVAAAAALGAGKVVAAGRNAEALERARSLGASDTIMLDNRDLRPVFQQASSGGFDIVLDYLNGVPAEAALTAMAVGGRMVQIGSTLAPGMQLNAQIARRNSLDVLGFAYYHAPIEEQRGAYRQLCQLALSGGIFLDFETHDLSAFEAAWAAQKSGVRKRQVIMMDRSEPNPPTDEAAAAIAIQ